MAGSNTKNANVPRLYRKVALEIQGSCDKIFERLDKFSTMPIDVAEWTCAEYGHLRDLLTRSLRSLPRAALALALRGDTNAKSGVDRIARIQKKLATCRVISVHHSDKRVREIKMALKAVIAVLDGGEEQEEINSDSIWG